MIAIRLHCCPSCGKTLRPRPLADLGRTREIILDCKECHLSIIKPATSAAVFAAAAR
jgi:ribosomal protein L37AE/L43A